jgi:hypothetical protein
MSSERRTSERDRQLAIHGLEGFFERGVISKPELEDRKRKVEQATRANEIESCIADLRSGRRGRGDLRISDDERKGAKRRLQIHLEEGHLEETEWRRRDDLVGDASTAAEIKEALAELPPLKPARERREDRLASNSERQIAIERLDAAFKEGRLELEEYEQRSEVVSAARTRAEVHSAFRGIPQHRLGQPHLDVKMAGHVAKGVGREAVRAGFALARAFVIIGWAFICAVIVLVWLISGMGAAVPISLIALVSLVSIVLLWAPGLVPRRR